MRRITGTLAVVSLLVVVFSGCDLRMAGANGQGSVRQGTGDAYLDKTAIKDETKTGTNNAVDAAMEWARKYAQVAAKRDELIRENRTLMKKQYESQQQIIKFQMELSRAEKELNEANEMLLEMRGELEKWKASVLGFRNEMRQAQKAQLNAMAKILMLVGGEMPENAPTTRPAALSKRKAEEKSGEANQ